MRRLAGLDLKIFLESLKQCFTSEVRGHNFDETNALVLNFDLKPDDPRLRIFSQLVPGKWRPPSLYRIEDFSFLSGDFFKFLSLTKLVPRHMRNLVAMEPRFAPFLEKIDEKSLNFDETEVKISENAANLVFDTMKSKKMTYRRLSEAADLTQVSLHHFRKGQDIRLSSLTRICEALGLRVILRRDIADKDGKPC